MTPEPTTEPFMVVTLICTTLGRTLAAIVLTSALELATSWPVAVPPPELTALAEELVPSSQPTIAAPLTPPMTAAITAAAETIMVTRRGVFCFGRGENSGLSVVGPASGPGEAGGRFP